MHVMVTIFKLQTGLSINDLRLAKDAKCLVNVEVFGGGRILLFKYLRQKSVQRLLRLLLFQTEKQIIVFGSQFSILQLSHHLLVFFLLLGRILS